MNKNLLNSHIRALIKRVETIPNVSEFYTFKYSVDEYALIYGIEKVLRKIEVKAHTNGKTNKYLLKQFYRLSKYAIEGNREAYAKLSDRLVKRSISFRIVAMNRKFRDWFLVNSTRRLKAVWGRLGGIIKHDSSDINFKRVWIDKKPNDYARPLGVPTMEWRIFSWMKMEIIERYLKGGSLLATWQHGGRSGVGVLSCWKALLPKIQSSSNVYEFDIRGFFDNISHKSIISEFQFYMPFMSEWIKGILKSKVKGYVLPPREADKAIEAVKQEAFDFHEDEFGMNIPEECAEFVMDNMRTMEERLTDPVLAYGVVMADFMDEEDLRILKEGLDLEMNNQRYKALMDGEKIGLERQNLAGYPINSLKPFSEDVRAKARDAWKGIGLASKGVPQGLGTSPLISTFMTDTRFTEIQENILMYMDDGLLFANTEDEMKKVIRELKASLRMMGLSIAKEKSGWIKRKGEWINKEPKFLGMRYLVEENTITSDTRSGTKVKFPVIGEWPKIAALAAYNELSIPYMRKKFDKLLQTKSWEAGIKYGFLGCLIAEASYRDAPPMWVRKLEVKAGQERRLNEIERNQQGFLWRSGEMDHWTGSIHSITSIASARMLNKRTRTKVLKYGAVGRGRKPRGRWESVS